MSSAEKKKHEHRRPWRDNLEALTMAIVMAVMLKYFAVEAYKIPTGSMQPTLLGNDETGVFDRILVDKFSFHFRDPERFEVCVFKYPLDRSKTFIKRVCGMPGEDLAIRYGDLWTRPNSAAEWKVLRRPRPIQTETWRTIDAHDPRYASWRPIEDTKGWTARGRTQVAARGSGAVRLPNDGGSVFDSYRDGYVSSMAPKIAVPPSAAMRNAVGDVRIEGEVSALAGTKLVTVELREGARRYRFEIPGPAAAADARPRIVSDNLDGTIRVLGEALASATWKLEAGDSIDFAAQNMDDELQLEVNGDIVATLEIESVADQPSSITLRVDGEGADFDDLELARDIYYTEGTKGREFSIPPNAYVMLGDNTQNSSDSREWQFVKFRWPGEGSNGQWARGNWYPPQNPTIVMGAPEGARVFFRDEWGELHDFLSPPGERDSTLDPAPYVTRDLVIGRAVVVFWPQTIVSKILWFMDGGTPLLWRLKWIH